MFPRTGVGSMTMFLKTKRTFIWFSILVFSSDFGNIDAQSTSCVTTYWSPTGFITSPNYPNNYTNNLNCTYNIQASYYYVVNITFIAFSTQATFDWVEINCTANPAKTYPRFSGTNLPPFMSLQSCNVIIIRFYTDSSVVGQGFSLRYEVGLDCGGNFRGPTGVITSPNYPYNYNNNLNCTYSIEAAYNSAVNITFTAFSTQVTFDWLQVSCSANPTKTSSRFSGTDWPPFMSLQSCNVVTIRFITDSSSGLQGFSLHYESGLGLNGGIITAPMNTFVNINTTSSIVLSCKSNVTLAGFYPWWTFSANGNQPDPLTTSGCQLALNTNQGIYSTIKDGLPTSVCNLEIKTTYMSSASGVYTCIDSTLASASAIVASLVTSLRSERDLNSATTEVVRDDDFNITCNVLFGQIPVQFPVIKTMYSFFSDGKTIVNATNISISEIVTAHPDILPSYSCDINFTVSGNFPPGFATNLPMNSSVSTRPRQVLYWPEKENLTITGELNGKMYANGGSLTCYVPANPPATYLWTEVKLGITSQGPTIYVSHDGTYTCTGTNFIRGRIYMASKTIDITVDIKSDVTDKQINVLALIVGVVLGTGIIILILIIVVILIRLHRKKTFSQVDPVASTADNTVVHYRRDQEINLNRYIKTSPNVNSIYANQSEIVVSNGRTPNYDIVSLSSTSRDYEMVK